MKLWIRGPIAMHFLAGCAVLGLIFHRILWRLDSHYYGPGDSDQNIWFGWRFATSFRSGTLFPTRFDDVVVPIGLDLRLIDGYLALRVSGLDSG
jgi:hypothetical protein